MGSMESKPALTPQEQMKEYKREIDRACRELERERRKLELENQKLSNEMKQQAARGQEGPLKIMAKNYVRTKKQINKFYQLRAHLQGVGTQLQTMKSIDAMANAMRNTTKAMTMMSRRLNMPQLQGIMRGFAMESDRMEMVGEVMGDTLDGVLEGEDDEEEADAMVDAVLTELNIKRRNQIGEVGRAAPAAVAAAPVASVAPVAVGADGGAGGMPPPPPAGPGGGDGSGGAPPPAAPPPPPGDFAARLEALRKKP